MIFENAFYVLGATTRDSRQKIVELAEEKSFELDEEQCQKARSDLTMPRIRLIAELNWFPGVSPRKIETILSKIQNNAKDVIHTDGLPEIARINLLGAILDNKNFNLSNGELIKVIIKVVETYDNLSVKSITRDINEDRAVSHFPEVIDLVLVENELTTKKRSCTKLILASLNNLDTLDLIKVITTIIDIETIKGEFQASSMYDDLIDDYKLHTQDYLEQEFEKIKKLIEAIKERASEGESTIEPLVERLIKVTKAWDDIAQPIQLSLKSRGLDDELSIQVAQTVRLLGVDLYNDYGYLELSKKISVVLKELFAELPEILERVEEDIDTLDDLFYGQQKAKEEKKQLLDELNYNVEIGLIIKDTLSISVDGVRWKNRTYPIDSITRVTWGATRHSVNGVPTGTTYSISFGNTKRIEYVETKREDIYEDFTNRLWKTAGVTILTNMLKDFKSGEGLTLGGCTVWDDGVTLEKSGWFSSEKHKFGWSDIQIWSSNGNLIIGASSNKKFSVEMPYLNVYNIHFLESAIRMMFKNQYAKKLSDLIDN